MKNNIPTGYTWGHKNLTSGRRMHIVDWDASFDYGVSTVAVCGQTLDRANWTDDNWTEQQQNPPAHPARPCPECVRAVRKAVSA